MPAGGASDRVMAGPPGGSRPWPVRIGAALVVVIAVLVGGLWLFGGTPPSPSGVAAAATSTLAASSVALASPPASATEVATSEPPRDAPSVTPAPTPRPTKTPKPRPTTTPEPVLPSGNLAGADGHAATIHAAALQRRLDAWRVNHHVPGVSVAILTNDGRSWLGASGFADIAAGTAVTPDTGFALASISKTFTAAVVLQLIGEGKLKVDEPVAPLLPAFRIDKRVTIRELLDHTSDINDYFSNPKIDRALQANRNATWTAQQAWKFVPPGPIRPGKTWAYSNTNYMLLGQLVEKVTGNPLAEEVRNRILDPLKLDNAWYQAVEKPKTPLTVGYRYVPGPTGPIAKPVARPSDVMPFRSVITAAGGAGSIAATAEDTARWMQAFAGGRVLSPAMQAAMLGDFSRTRALYARITYGLGIQLVSIDGHAALGHSGRYLGYRNVVRYLPSEGVTIAVLTNQGDIDPAVVAAALLKIVLGS
jgi:CubicO group peptidase (beta-lactamase class C family)